MGGRSGLLRCGWSWVWAPDQVWGDGSWGWGLRWYGAGSRSGAGMTEVVRCSDGAAHVEIPAASAGMTEVGQEWRRDGVGITGGRGGMGRRGLCGGEVLQMDVGVWFGPSVLRRGLGWAPDQVWGDGAWGWGLRWFGAGSRSGAGMTEVGTGDGGRAGEGWGAGRGFCAVDGVGFGPRSSLGRRSLGMGAEVVWGRFPLEGRE